MGHNGVRSFHGDGAAWPIADCGSCDNRICGIVASHAPAPRRRDLARGERLDAASCLKLWTVLDGLVALCTALPDGRRQLVYLSTPGEMLCPLDGVDGTDVWLEALAPSRLCELDFTAQAPTIGEDAVLSAELFRILHRQVKCVSTHLVTLGRLDGMERVCLFLTDMAWRIGDKTPGGWRVSLPLSREDIADYLGLNAETVSRIFSRVKKAKLATFLSPTDYFVRDIKALQSRAPVAAPHGPRMPDATDLEARPLCPI